MKSNEKLASEWAPDPIDLEVKIRRAEKAGWERQGLPYRQEFNGTGIPIGWFVQHLILRSTETKGP